MRYGIILIAMLALGSSGYSEFIDTPADSAVAAQDTIKTTAPHITPVKMNAAANLGRHHITIAPLGYFKSTSDDLKYPGLDLSVGDAGVGSYRYTFENSIDLCVDMHSWGSNKTYNGVNVDMTIYLIGLGTRYTFTPLGGRVFPYVQGNLGFVYEDETDKFNDVSIVYSDRSLGFAVNGGAEIRLGRLISIPVDVFYLYGKPYHNVSGFGGSTGISFNWGKIK